MECRRDRLSHDLGHLVVRLLGYTAHLLACVRQLDVQLLDFLEEHQDRTTSSGFFLASGSLQALAPTPQRLELVFV